MASHEQLNGIDRKKKTEKTATTIIQKVFDIPASTMICWKKDSRISNKSQRVCAIIAMFSQQGVKGNWSAAWKWTTTTYTFSADHNNKVGASTARAKAQSSAEWDIEIMKIFIAELIYSQDTCK